MGYMRHHAIIVSGSSGDLEEAHARAKRLFDSVSPILGSRLNDVNSFLIPPDGSKEGWEDSNIGDTRRESFKRWLQDHKVAIGWECFQWVEIQYGDGEGETKIINHSDE